MGFPRAAFRSDVSGFGQVRRALLAKDSHPRQVRRWHCSLRQEARGWDEPIGATDVLPDIFHRVLDPVDAQDGSRMTACMVLRDFDVAGGVPSGPIRQHNRRAFRATVATVSRRMHPVMACASAQKAAVAPKWFREPDPMAPKQIGVAIALIGALI